MKTKVLLLCLFAVFIVSCNSNKKEETQWEHFQNEVSEAFSHFKNAFSKVPH